MQDTNKRLRELKTGPKSLLFRRKAMLGTVTFFKNDSSREIV